MSYLHCHNCGWQQDDFWSKSYNPLVILWRDIKSYWFPKWVASEKWIIRDYKYRWYRVRYMPDVYEPGLFYQVHDVLSVELLYRSFKRLIKVYKNMKWETYEKFKHDPYKKCPGCRFDAVWDID